MAHPWRDMRDRDDVVVVWTKRLPPDMLGGCDGEVIWMSTDQSQAQRRSTLAHELEHHRRGHGCRQGPRQEVAVSQAAARRLIDIESLARAIAWSRDEAEVAEELWVDVGTVRARLAGLDDYERGFIEKTVAAIEEAL